MRSQVPFMKRVISMLTRWIRLRRVFGLNLYILYVCLCGMTVIILSTVFSGFEVYQVRLVDEIKGEIDLSIETDGDRFLHMSSKVPKTRAGNSKPTQISPYNLPEPSVMYSNRHHQALYEEETQNKLLMKNEYTIQQIVTSVNKSSPSHPCIGKPAQQEFIFHKIFRDIYIFSAFWDARWNDFDNKPNRTFIRMMGITSKEKKNSPLSCLFYIRGAYHIIPAYDYEMCEDHNKKHGGFIYSCEVPAAVKSTVCSVLVAYGDTADPKWATRIPVTDTRSRQVRHGFSQCVPPLFGSIDADRLIEFIELSRMLGSEHITFYNLRAPENIKNVLQYYQMKGIASVIPWPLPQVYDTVNLWYHGQMIAIQDCLYRNMVFTDFLAFNDLDEYIIPRSHKTWKELISATDRSNKYIGYVFRSSFFDPRQKGEAYSWIKEFKSLTVVQDVMRSEMISQFRNKCIVKPREIFEKGIHHVSKPVSASMETYNVNSGVALLHHYRQCAATHGQNCDKFVQDRQAWKYAAGLHERVRFAKKWIEKLASWCVIKLILQAKINQSN